MLSQEFLTWKKRHSVNDMAAALFLHMLMPASFCFRSPVLLPCPKSPPADYPVVDISNNRGRPPWCSRLGRVKVSSEGKEVNRRPSVSPYTSTPAFIFIDRLALGRNAGWREVYEYGKPSDKWISKLYDDDNMIIYITTLLLLLNGCDDNIWINYVCISK